MFKLDFAGRQVLVLGGSSGIGNGIACAFRDAGADVVVTGTKPRSEDYVGSDLEGSDTGSTSLAAARASLTSRP